MLYILYNVWVDRNKFEHVVVHFKQWDDKPVDKYFFLKSKRKEKKKKKKCPKGKKKE